MFETASTNAVGSSSHERGQPPADSEHAKVNAYEMKGVKVEMRNAPGGPRNS